MNAFDYLFGNSKYFDKLFVLGAKEEVSFKQLYEESLKLACYLKTSIGENNNVLLIGPNSIFFITAYLGIIKSGNVCVPLNTSVEQATLDYVIQGTGSKLAFIASKINLNFDRLGTAIVCEKTLPGLVKGQEIESDLFLEGFEDNRVAEILFTSGSTGAPKGVMLSHRNICRNTESIVKYLNFTSQDIIGAVLPFSYCYGLSLLHTHLRVGGSIVLLDNFIFLASVINDLKKYRCTGFAGVPSHFQILLRKSQTFIKTEFPDLKYVTQAGGRLHDVFIEEFIEAFPCINFFVMYGQTEATARLAYLSPEYLAKKLGSIGKAIPGVTLQVLNEDGLPAGAGEVGEIVAKGDNVMIGYFNDPEATRAAIKNGWLYTGDLGRMDEDDFIYLVGRKKEIIKVGGRRVSPREIEAVILSVPGIVDCTVEGIYDELLGEAIKANVVLEQMGDESKKRDEILSVCGQKLSLYKMPRIIHFHEAIKVSGSGKKQKYKVF